MNGRATVAAVSPRTRVTAVVAASAAAAALVAVGAALLQADDDAASAAPQRPRGAPPLQLDLGFRADPEARELRRAAALYATGSRRQAAGVFARHRSLDARVGEAMASWPDGTVARLEELVDAHPRSALARLNLGFALFWSGRREEAVSAWREARRVQPDSLSAVRADDLLHPGFPRGLPIFVPTFEPPRAIASLPAGRQVAALARSETARGKLLYGVALQRLGRPRSAERAFAAAAALAPQDLEAQVAAAVGRFDKTHPDRAFSRLGPLARRYPRSTTVRFHLGLLLLWLGQVDEAKRQLRLAASSRPKDSLTAESKRLLARLE
jgi:tetratricopeptide (TPR) repeat protein